MHYLIRRFVTLSLLAALPGACTEKGEETTAASATDTSGDSTGGSGDDSTGATSEDSSSTGEPTTGEPTTGEPTTGEPSALCVAYIEWVYMCGQGDPLGEDEALVECERQREQTAVVYGPDCGAKSDAYIECISKSACDDFDACEAEAEATDVCLPPAGETCMKFGATVAACEPGEDEAELASGCQFEINAGNYQSAECGAAMEALYGCYGDLTCEQIAEDGVACSQQEAMTEVLCPGQSGLVQSRHLDSHRR